MKAIGSILALVGGILAFVNALAYFFVDKLMYNFNYNTVHQAGNGGTIEGIILFFLATLIILLSLFALKHPRAHIHYITLLVCGAIILVMPAAMGQSQVMFITYLAGILILVGGAVGGVAMYRRNKA